ncbi:chaperonin 10-like protein [Dipodascopsis tothii]|uniref:chaperonin 10-like protein n=1 Tax=Dipodascopsis tothii TaxID=44089 RepID=UPI0034CE1FD0
MKALRFYARGDIRFETEVAEPTLSANQNVLIAPKWCGICGTDLHEYLDGPIFCPQVSHKITNEKVPVTLGHEFAGVVLKVGPGVTHVKAGDHVCVEASIRCNSACAQCRDGRTNCCTNGAGFIGLSGWGGGLSERIAVPSSQVFKLPRSLPIELGALVEPLSVAWHAIRISGFKSGMTALVLGSGPIGLATIVGLKAFGASQILVSEPASIRRQQAEKLGVSVVDPSSNNIVDYVRKHCIGAEGAEGADFSYDCSGVQATFDASLAAIKPGGTAFNIAIWGRACSYHPNDLLLSEKHIGGSIGYVGQDFAEVIEAISDGRIKVDEISNFITAKIAVKDIVHEGFEQLIKNKDQHIKIIATCDNNLLS